MPELTFTIELQRHGVLLHKLVDVPARESGIVGCWHDGKPYMPCVAQTLELLPYHYRKAFERSVWWASDAPRMPLRRDLHTSKGHVPMGTLHAIPNWS